MNGKNYHHGANGATSEASPSLRSVLDTTEFQWGSSVCFPVWTMLWRVARAQLSSLQPEDADVVRGFITTLEEALDADEDDQDANDAPEVPAYHAWRILKNAASADQLVPIADEPTEVTRLLGDAKAALKHVGAHADPDLRMLLKAAASTKGTPPKPKRRESGQAPVDADAVLAAAPGLFRVARESGIACAVVLGHIESGQLFEAAGHAKLADYARAELGIASDAQLKKVRVAAHAVWKHYPREAQAVLEAAVGGYARNRPLPPLPDLTALARLERAFTKTVEAERPKLLADVAAGKVSTRALEGIARASDAQGKPPSAPVVGASHAAPATIDASTPKGQEPGVLPASDEPVAADRLVVLQALGETLRGSVVNVGALDLAAENERVRNLQKKATKKLRENVAAVEALIAALVGPPPSGGSGPRDKRKPTPAAKVARPTLAATENAKRPVRTPRASRRCLPAPAMTGSAGEDDTEDGNEHTASTGTPALEPTARAHLLVVDPFGRRVDDGYIRDKVASDTWRQMVVPPQVSGMPRPMTILLARRTSNLIKFAFHGDARTFCPLQWADIAIGSGACGYACRSCFLMLTHRARRDPMVPVVYDNGGDFERKILAWLTSSEWDRTEKYKDELGEIRDRLVPHPRPRLGTIGLGIDCADSLLWEGVTGHARRFIPLFTSPTANPRNTRLILLTKSANVGYLAELSDPQLRRVDGLVPNVSVTMSLNPESIADLWEGKFPDTGERMTPPIAKRLEALRAAQDLGFDVRMRVDPILTPVGWQEMYAGFFNEVVHRYGLRPSMITLGTYREKMPQIDTWREKWGLPPMEFEPETTGARDGTHVHVQGRAAIYDTVKSIIINAFERSILRPWISLCKETFDVRKQTNLLNANCNCLQETGAPRRRLQIYGGLPTEGAADTQPDVQGSPGLLKTKRWNDPKDEDDGFRLLVCLYRPMFLREMDKTWDAWAKHLGPSPELHRALYPKHGPRIAWAEYSLRYLTEMSEQSEAIAGLAGRVANGETITLLCSSACKDESRCHRTLLKELVETALAG